MSVSKIAIFNLVLTNANEEYSQALPQFCSRVDVKAREFADLKLAYTAGVSGTTYTSVPAGVAKTIIPSDGQTIVSLTLYLQSPNAGTVVEIEAQL